MKVVQELKELDYAARISFCNWLLLNVYDGLTDPQLLFITYEALLAMSVSKM
jgi:hypothetical protein